MKEGIFQVYSFGAYSVAINFVSCEYRSLAYNLAGNRTFLREKEYQSF